MRPEQPENPEEEGGFSGDPDGADPPPSDGPDDPPAGTSGDQPGAGGEPPDHAARSRPGDALLGRSLALVRHLREHCPWDARQTPESLRPYLLEEAHETADVILADDPDELAGELGDLLLNLAFQVVVAEERDAFDAREVVERLEAKMEARHPHVYGDAEEPPDWEETKAAERREGEGGDPLAGVPEGLDPLSRALRVQQRAAAVGFDWPDVRGALAKLREEAAELEEELDGGAEPGGGAAGDGPADGARAAAPDGPSGARARAGGTVPGARLEEEAGDLLFAAVNVVRLAGTHPETALAAANAKFERRFRALLEAARERDLDPSEASLEELEALWREGKENSRGAAPDGGTDGRS